MERERERDRDHERDRERGRTSRASSTSSLGREVRCGCQYYRSDSLLPERRALVGRPSSRTAMQTPPPVQAGRCEHEYEPIATPAPTVTTTVAAPVVRITDTDVVHVADSDESIDARDIRFPPKLALDGDVVLPLDGQIEDNAMEGRELGETVDTSEDQETAQQLQDRLEERFLNAATPCTESRTDGEVNTSQVDSSALEELPLQRGARGLPQRLRTQAGKLRSRLKGIQRPRFALPERQKTEKTIKTEKTKTTKTEKPKVEKRTRMERFRSSLPDRPRFSLPDRPKFNLPDRPKFNLPERSKFHMPERSRFSLPERVKFTMPERPRFNIKKPNIQFPGLNRASRSLRERQPSTESTSGTKRNIFDFSTYPRIFDKKSKSRGEYATSSPKDSRAQSTESSTFPRAKKGSLSARWAQRIADLKFADEEPEAAVQRSKPWRHPSLEEPRLALGRDESSIEEPERLPWEESGEHSAGRLEDEDIRYEEDSAEARHPDLPEIEEAYAVRASSLRDRPIADEDSFERSPGNIDPRLYGDQGVRLAYEDEHEDDLDMHEELSVEEHGPRGESFDKHDSLDGMHEKPYGEVFQPIDPRSYDQRVPSEEEEEEPVPEESIHSDKEQQSSGSSCDRRRRGVIEEIDSDEFFLREKGISQDDMNVGKYLASEIRDAFRIPGGNALADEDMDVNPPTRPTRTRSLRKRKDDSIESYNTVPPARPKRDRRRSEESDYSGFFPEKGGSISGSRHRIIYQTEAMPRSVEPLDDIVVVKPARRKSRTSMRSQSQLRSESLATPDVTPLPPTPPVAPRRRKRGRREIETEQKEQQDVAVCNGHEDWAEGPSYPVEGVNYPAENLVMRLDQEYIEPLVAPAPPVAPKRMSRSRATSVADDDRTSRGAESLPEIGYLEDDIPQDTNSQDLPGYASVEKKEKPPRPPPPRRRRDKFATSPRPSVQSAPARPQRAYSTLGPARSHSLSDTQSQNQLNVTPYTELDSDEDHKDLRSGEVLSKIQGRPLPAPPRPPRARKEHGNLEQANMISNGVGEVVASTQTDPLPDDLVIEEEITQAKLIMAPSRSGSQILVSTERIPSPIQSTPIPVVPPLPQNLRAEKSSPSPSLPIPSVDPEERPESPKPDERPRTAPTPTFTPEQIIRSVLSSDEPLRIGSLEVGDLRVDRLSVSQLEAHKISASEIDAIVVSASEMSNAATAAESDIHPSLLRELIAIRSHLETVAISQAQGRDTFTESVILQRIEESVKPPETTNTDTRLTVVEESIVPASLVEGTEAEKLKEETEAEPKVEGTKKEVSDGAIKVPSAQAEATPVSEPKPETESKQEEVAKNPSLSTATVHEKAEIQSEQLNLSSQTLESISLETSLESESQTYEKRDFDSKEPVPKSRSRSQSRSRSPSPGRGPRAVRQTASPVRSLPPVISVTPDTPDSTPSQIIHTEVQPQRAVISYSHDPDEESQTERSQSPLRSFPPGTQFVAFPTSQIPANFFSLSSPSSFHIETEPTIVDTTHQLLRALRVAGSRAMRHFVSYIVSRIGGEETGEKTREVELALCALLLLIAGLLIVCFGSPRTITYHHHWDYFNPPK